MFDYFISCVVQIFSQSVLPMIGVLIVIAGDAIILKDVFLHGKLSTRTIGTNLVPLFGVSGVLYALDSCTLVYISVWVAFLLGIMPFIRVGIAIQTKSLSKIPFITFTAVVAFALGAYVGVATMASFISLLNSIPRIL